MTLIILLILAGVSISAVVGNQGIFKKAEQASEIYNRGKAREKLELTLTDAQVVKYTEGLTDEQLTDRINEIGEEIEERENPDVSQAIVDGYIFSIDRTVPKILDYIGPADGIIITARVDYIYDWVNPSASISGTIKTYSKGATIISSIATTETGKELSEFVKNGESYTISNITEDTTITINAEDSSGKRNSKAIEVKIIRDKTGPIITSFKAKAEGLKITIEAKAEDNESGLSEMTYEISPATGLEKSSGKIIEGQPVIVTSTDERKYQVIITAKDIAGNSTKSEAITVETIDGLTIAEVREKVTSNSALQKYIGTKVIDYKPEKGRNMESILL